MSPQELEVQIDIAIRSVEEARRQAHRDLTKRGRLIAQLHALAKLRMQQGDFSRAESLYREAFECTKDRRKIDPEEVVHIHCLLGDFYNAWSKPAEATEYYTKALEYGEEAGLQHSMEMAGLKSHLARLLKASGKADEAIAFYQQAVEAFRASNAGKDARLASVYDELGALFYQKMELDQALEMHQKALAISQQTRGRDYSSTYQNLNLVYRAMGDFERAFECVQSAAQIKSAVSA